MAQPAGKSRSKPTRNSDSVLGEGELSAQHAYLFSCIFLLMSCYQIMICTCSRYWGNL